MHGEGEQGSKLIAVCDIGSGTIQQTATLTMTCIPDSSALQVGALGFLNKSPLRGHFARPLVMEGQTSVLRPPVFRLQELPNELILIVAGNICFGGLLSLVRASRRLWLLLSSTLYRRGAAIKRSDHRGGTYTLLLRAVHDNHEDLVQRFLKHGADVNGVDHSYHWSRYAWTKARTFPYLSASGVPLGLKNGSKVLHGVQTSSMARLLLSYGANINAQDEAGDTPFHYLFSNRKYHRLICSKIISLARVFIEAGADLSVVNKSGLSGLQQLMLATEVEGSLDTRFTIFDIFLDNGQDINSRDQAGYTALHYAASSKVQKGRLQMIRYLLEKGANVMSRTPSGRTSLQLAEVNGWRNLSMVELLRSYIHRNLVKSCRQL